MFGVFARWRSCFGRRTIAWLLLLLLFAGVAGAAVVLLPVMTDDGQKTKNGTVVDIGNVSQGYIQVKHRAGKKRLKLRISCGEETYTYDLNQNGEFEVFPLQMGSGNYKVSVYEQVKGTQYSGVSNISFKADIADENLPYLYPNQYIWFDAQSEAVAMSDMLCSEARNDEEKVRAVERFVAGRFMYDYLKSLSVRSDSAYLPDVDATLASRQGICFDFAALICCMLRAQGIPTQLVIGYADSAYHAWNRVLVDGDWRLIDITAQITNTAVRQYTAQRRY